MVLEGLALAFFATSLALVAADLLSWRRTAWIRPSRRRPFEPARTETGARPRPAPDPWPRGSLRSSPATFLAALAGVLALAWASAAGPDHHVGAVAVAPWGAFVAASGLRARVTALDVQGAGLCIRYAAKPSFFVSWASLRSLRAPRTPLGGWRIDSVSGAVTLMPSDLFGHEGVLEAMVCLGVLTFDGRAWSRGPAPPVVATTVR